MAGHRRIPLKEGLLDGYREGGGATERSGSPVISALLDPYASRPVYFAGKAAPAYKLASTINRDPAMRAAGSRLCFCPSTALHWAERRIGASDDCNQISTAGYETSGTSNIKFMKFIMNGLLFGLTRDQVAGTRSWYNSQWHYNETETRAAPDLVFSHYCSPNGRACSNRCGKPCLTGGDYSMNLADLKSYLQAQDRLGDLDTNQDAWAPKALLNVASSGKSSSDRSIAEYAADIWGISPCPVQ
jgi:starch phosphorylase